MRLEREGLKTIEFLYASGAGNGDYRVAKTRINFRKLTAGFHNWLKQRMVFNLFFLTKKGRGSHWCEGMIL